jgi:hypothetical protein
MHTLAFGVRTCLLVVALSIAAAPGRADAAWSDVVREGVDAAQQTLREKAEQAIIAGGVLLCRHRHAVAGAALGCVAGSVAATTTTLGAGLARRRLAHGRRACSGARLPPRRAPPAAPQGYDVTFFDGVHRARKGKLAPLY